jgi:SWI/SNF-related matrix-associated actin-dependent regulator 1 of chromatin subfamily A
MMKHVSEIYLTSKVLICSYDIISSIIDKIKRFNFNIAIADEAHYLKNLTAKRTQVIVPYLKRLRHVILLTGTPAFARPMEMFALLQIVRPDVFK